MKSLFQNRNFLALFLGRMITNMGDSIYYVASMWLVYQMSGSAFYTGVAGFLILLPKTLQFLTGPLVDQWDTKKTLITTQVLQCVLILIIPVAYMFDMLSVILILIVMPLLAIIEEFAYPAQTKILPLIVEKENLVKGNSFLAFAYQGVDMVFNALTGILVTLVGAITLYWIDSITFAMAAICFGIFKLVKPINHSHLSTTTKVKYSAKQYWKDLMQGFKVVFHSLLWFFLIGLIVANFAIGSSMAILPAFADQIGGAKTYGILLAALSAGSLLGALCGTLLSKFNVGKLAIVCFSMGAICWTLSALLQSPIWTAILFGCAWIFIGAINVLFAGVFQAVIPNELLGRVNSVMTSISVVAMPLGSLLGGYFATQIAPTTLFSFTGLGLLFVAIIWFIHPKLRSLPKVIEINSHTLHLDSILEKTKESSAKNINLEYKAPIS